MNAAPRFPARLLGPVAISSAAACGVPGLAPWAIGVLAGGFVVRLVLLALRREPPSSRIWFTLAVSTPSVATAWVAIQAGTNRAAGPALISVACALLGLSLAGPPTAFALALLTSLSLAQIAGAAVLYPSPALSVACVVYVAVLMPVMVRLATVLAAPRRSESVTVIRRVVAAGAQRRSGFAATVRFLAVALPLGFWFFVALPHRAGGEGPAAQATAADERDRDPTREGREAAASEGALSSFVSGGKTGMRLGFVSRVQKNQKPVLLVTVDGGVRGPEPLTLRGMAYDVFTGTDWRRSAGAARPSSAAPADDGWVPIAPSVRPERRHDLVIEDLGGDPKAHLFLAPDPIRVQLDARAPDRRVGAAPDGVIFAFGSMPQGGVYREEAEYAPDRGVAKGRRSDGSVAPDPHCVEAPPDAARYREIARRVVAGRTDASDRAEQLERWLKTEFAYTTDMPKVAADRPVLDFLERIRRGHCEYFASSMALLMRSLGHATRIAVGFRGGDYLETMHRWSFRGTHAHAWCEVFFEGVGWVLYDPTPGIDAAADRTTGSAGAGADDASLWERLVRFSAGDRRRLAERAGQIGRALLAAVAGNTSFGLWPTLATALVALALYLRSRRARSRVLGAVDARGRPLGPYGMALALLAEVGLARRESEAGLEFVLRVGSTRPTLATDLARLTSLHESARFGLRAGDPADLAAADAALASLRAAAMPYRAGRPLRTRA